MAFPPFHVLECYGMEERYEALEVKGIFGDGKRDRDSKGWDSSICVLRCIRRIGSIELLEGKEEFVVDFVECFVWGNVWTFAEKNKADPLICEVRFIFYSLVNRLTLIINEINLELIL